MIQAQEETKEKPDRTLYEKQFAQAESRPSRPVYLCDAWPSGFIAQESFYVIYCKDCGHCSVSHPRGMARLICCSSCSLASKVDSAIDPRNPPPWRVALLRLRIAAREYFGLDDPQGPHDP